MKLNKVARELNQVEESPEVGISIWEIHQCCQICGCIFDVIWFAVGILGGRN